MGVAENKAVVEGYFGALNKQDFPTVIGTFADDVTWWVPPSSPLAGLYKGKEAVLGLFGKGTGLYDPTVPMQARIEGMVGEGDYVAAQVIIKARTAKGKDYENHYHFLFKVQGGKFKEVKEYVDTLYSQKTLFE
ncbi:MAG: nuclear transport factor 2 family protein [Candidatus Methylomirabilis sp.]|nr:nuclear transport factor 2 family protein [Deltaproteobacteria bacterium]